jgi:hypothetical protein
MKNKIIYLCFLIFSASMISSAKKTPGTCSKISARSEVEIKKCKEAKKTEADKETDVALPSLGLFFFNI